MPLSPADIIKHYVDDGSSVERVNHRKSIAKIAIVEPNPSWPQRFLDTKARIEAALGSTAVAVLHIGSTSVPDLPAKDVIDVDLVVKDIKDEDSYVQALERAGFLFLFREPAWHEHRFFVDEGDRPGAYPINLHVFGPDCPEVEKHRIFRGWLSKSPKDLQLYATVKRESAAASDAAGESIQEYTIRKEKTVREILDRAFRDLGYIKGSAHPPQPAYQASLGSILHADRDFYTSIARAERQSVETFTLPIRSGRAWTVPEGHVVRISTPEGAQVGDLNIWNLHNPRERFWAARTRQLHASHVSTFDRLWSCLPYLRPMVTIISDSLDQYGVDEWGGRCHDLLGTRCDPYVNYMLSSDSYDFHCHSNLTRAVLPFGLTEFDVHDVINLFQVTGLDKDGKYFMETCPAKQGDYIEFFTEQPLLMALSTCPGGDLSAWGWGEGTAADGGEKKSMIDCCRPLKVEVFKMTDDTVLRNWKPFQPPAYQGVHGMNIPNGEASTSS
jgi:uncharacterized protein YcgI (DUF1989 family)/GrpB-like predicted nucleotidyltransferase (UPF0157 family)